MSGDPHVVVLLHNPPAEVLVPWHDNLTVKQEQSVRDLPFGRVGRRGLPVLEKLPGDKRNGILEFRLSRKRLPNVAQEGDFGSVNHNPLHRPDPEKLRPKERNIRVLGSGAVVWAAGEHIQATHEATRLVEQGEIEPGQVQGPPGLPPVQILRLLEVLQVLVIRPDLDRVLRAFEEVPPLL
jgi:hypothetical protein